MAPKLATQLLVLQPTPFCNINCSYCYLPNRQLNGRMSDEVIGAAIERLVASGRLGPTLCVLWHAGEPLILSPSYYGSAMSIIEARVPASTLVTYNFQTNGTLIDEAWCRFFSRPNIRVGVSVDGPQHLHDLYRVNRRGEGTFHQTISGLRQLRRAGIELSVITVLTRNALFFPDEFYDFYIQEGISRVCFNIDEIEGVNQRSTLQDPRCDTLFVHFFERFLELVSRDRLIKSVRELDHVFAAIGRIGEVQDGFL